MKLEVEQKYRVDDLGAVERALVALGARPRGVVTQVDQYFAHPARDFARTDEALRIRSVGDDHFVTYKGPKLATATKTRRELELPLAGGATGAQGFATLLEALGFSRVLAVQKDRHAMTLRWQDRTVEVALDAVASLGTFVEIELLVEAAGAATAQACVLSLAQELGLVQVERRSYLEMLLEVSQGKPKQQTAMRLLDLTLDSPQENVALDEALLEVAEAAGTPTELLRLWEPRQAFVVLGRSSKAAEEANLPVCQQRGIDVIRRSSGGAAIVAAPGCLMYALVLSYERRPALRWLDKAHCQVLDTICNALGQIVPGVRRQGTSDLTLGTYKFSGNSLRCKRTHFLYHGTLLYDFPLELIGTCLGTAPRQPDYRQGRPHGSFVTNLPASGSQLRQALIDGWQAHKRLDTWPRERVAQLVAEKYSLPDWNLRT